MVELAQAVLRLTGSTSSIIFKPLPVDDPRQRKPDITLAKTQLGWEPKICLEDGLRLTIEHFRKRLNIPARRKFV